MKITSTSKYPIVSISMAKIGFIKDTPIGVPVDSYIQNIFDGKVILPSFFTVLKVPELANTQIWWDRQKNIFTVLISDSFPDIWFNVSPEGKIISCEFIWDSYKVRISNDRLSTLSIKDLAKLAKSAPHIKFQYLLDFGNPNKATREVLEWTR
jgi:hypothetical protein